MGSIAPLFLEDRLALESGLPFGLFELVTDNLFAAAGDAAVTLGELQWLREAKTACMFGRLARANWARLNSTDSKSFDCEVKLRHGHLFKFQIAEVVAYGRRRTDEYRQWKASGRPTVVSDDEFILRRAGIASALEAVVKKKSGIEYPNGVSLLLYFNIPTYGLWNDLVEDQCNAIGLRADVRFTAVWVVWGTRLMRCWPDPFKRRDFGLRTGPHELGSAIRAYETKTLLNEVFASDRDRA